MTQKKYLPNLDSLRGIAAILVVISHFEQIKSYKSFSYLTNWGIIGSIAVTVFFMLGGFLSTYFLINEKLKNKKINYSLFYSKRYIRIWPLYFLVLAITFFWWPAQMKMEYFYLCIFMMSNVAFAMYGLNPVTDVIWTLGVEDQYYLLHPQLFRIGKFNTIFKWFIGLFISYIIIRYSFKWFVDATRLNFFLGKTRFDNFLLGGIGAFIYYQSIGKISIIKTVSIETIFKKSTQIFTLSLVTIYLIYSCFIDSKYFSELIVSVILLPIILNWALNKNCIINIENNFFNFIGKISFSIYLSHKIFIYLFIVICKDKKIFNLIHNYSFLNLLLYPIIMFIVITSGWIIYHLVEKNILLLKEKIVVKSVG